MFFSKGLSLSLRVDCMLSTRYFTEKKLNTTFGESLFHNFRAFLFFFLVISFILFIYIIFPVKYCYGIPESRRKWNSASMSVLWLFFLFSPCIWFFSHSEMLIFVLSYYIYFCYFLVFVCFLIIVIKIVNLNGRGDGEELRRVAKQNQ